MRRVAVSLIIFIGVALGGQFPPGAAQAQSSPEPTVVQADESGLVLLWQPPPVNVTAVVAGGTTYSRLEIPGLPAAGMAGAPQTPAFGQLVGLPPGSGASLTILELELDTLTLPHPPLPAPTPQPVSYQPALAPVGGGPVAFAPDAALYNTAALFPAAPAELSPPEQVRGHTVARLSLNPVRVNPVSRQVVVIRRIKLQIRFDAPAPLLAGQGRPDAFAGALAAALLNPAAATWAAPERPAPGIEPTAPLLAAAAESAPLKVVVNQAGLTRLTYADLQAAGWPVDTLNPQTFRLSYGADFAPVSIIVQGEDDASFDPGDRILFFASPTFSRFTAEDVYFLQYDAVAPPRMASRSGNPAGLPAATPWRTATAEGNTIYEPGYAGHNGDRWYWKKLNAPGASLTAAIAVTNPHTGGPTASLAVWLQGYTSGNHAVKVWVNGQLAGTVTWSEKTQKQGQLAVPANWLQPGSNAIKLELTSLSGVLVDALVLRYPTINGGGKQLLFSGDGGPQAYTVGGWATAPIALDVTAPLTPTRVVSALFTAGSLSIGHADAVPRDYLLAPESDLKVPLRLEPAQLLADPAAGADMIIITHPAFAGAVAPLAAHRAGQGLRVVTVDVTAVYDTFGGGRMSSQAIRAFLEHAYRAWPDPAPLYVLLVGDGAYDFKNYSGFNPQNFIPPHLAAVDPWLGETASDNRLVNFDGGTLPSMWIGRLPVSSAAQAETVISKIIRYDTAPPPGSWNTRHLFVAGDECCDTTSPSSTSLQSQAEAGLARLPANGVGVRYYFDDSAAAAGPVYIYTDFVRLRNSLINSINYGASTLVFHGHSSVHQWNDEPLLRWSKVAADNDINRLVNGGRLPVVLSLTCFTGSFHHPEYPTLDESLLTRGGGGAVAAWGPTGLGVATGHELLQQGFYNSISGADAGLGAATVAGKLALYGGSAWPADRALIDTFTLFGDPAMRVNLTVRPFTDFVYLPLVQKLAK
ncbi:MAG: C25 family cysteine peptidase [Anaerolineae bacterium]